MKMTITKQFILGAALASFAVATRTSEKGLDFCPPPCIIGKESIMKRHNTSMTMPIQFNLRWGIEPDFANNICNYNRELSETEGFYLHKTSFLSDTASDEEINFHDVTTGNLLFTAPKGRTKEEFLEESKAKGWLCFRDAEVNWHSVRVIPEEQGEMVSRVGTHLGHNNPDAEGSHYCVNIACISGKPAAHSVVIDQKIPQGNEEIVSKIKKFDDDKEPTKATTTEAPVASPTKKPAKKSTKRPTKRPTRKPRKKRTARPVKEEDEDDETDEDEMMDEADEAPPTKKPRKKRTKRPTKKPTSRPTEVASEDSEEEFEELNEEAFDDSEDEDQY